MAEYQIRVNSSSGSGTGYTEARVTGLLMAVKVDYHASADAGTDVTISEADENGSNGLGRTPLTLTNTNTDVVKYPREEICDNTGAGTGQYQPIYLDNTNVKVVVAQEGGTHTDAVVVTLQLLVP